MKLIGSLTSPYVRKVRIVMAEKKSLPTVRAFAHMPTALDHS